MSTCFLILGTPRSGTTLVASILHALGVNMGERFVDGIPGWTPDHFYADDDCNNVLMPIWRGEFAPARDAHPEALAELKALIAYRAAKYPKWGIKTFGLPFCLPVLLPLLPSVRLIYCTRERESSVASWKARREPHTDDSEADMVIDTHTAAIEATLATWQGPLLTLDFDDVVKGPPQRAVDAIAAFVGQPSLPHIASMIDPSWKRF